MFFSGWSTGINSVIFKKKIKSNIFDAISTNILGRHGLWCFVLTEKKLLNFEITMYSFIYIHLQIPTEVTTEKKNLKLIFNVCLPSYAGTESQKPYLGLYCIFVNFTFTFTDSHLQLKGLVFLIFTDKYCYFIWSINLFFLIII